MNKKYTLIVGGAGYIGSHTAKLLYKYNLNIIIFDNLSTGYKKLVKYGKLHIGDLSNKQDIINVFEKYKIDTVIHFAAYAYVGESVKNPKKYYRNNVVNTINLLDTMIEFNCKKIIFSSTCATYGIPNYIPIDEQHPQNPINPYGNTKLIIERMLKDYDKAYSLKYVILRYFNAAGADFDGEIGELHHPETHLIPLAIDAALSNSCLSVFGNDYDTKDGSCIRDYIHVEDLADAHFKSYNYLNRSNISNIFNLGTQHGLSVFDIINAIESETNSLVNYEISKKREGDPPILIATSKKAKDILNWEARNSTTTEIIRSAVQWSKKQLK